MNWTGPTGDKTARMEDATLRVEQMDTDLWWWSVSFGNAPSISATDCHSGFALGRNHAMQAAEKAYKENRS